ncbi:hypothetical protein CTAYLR_006485 [Chrysophaeum taylorii]|uniref:tRNA-intron lyase n=1 Tax=Chrysophaeum taylorii TaxID=2483200 RepID=A0AAD7XP94_9STRA|nr:hypothetical protein CTAYLR_006485 [Chrysophaeum taylorii]
MLGWVWPRLFGKRRAEDITREFGEDAQLVFSRKTESILFHRFRMWTQRVGASRNVGHRGRKLPALMMPEQAAYAFGFERDPKRRRLLDGPGLTRKETDRDVVYRDLADRGYVVGSACRYGGDFVIYDSHPSRCHSKATIRVVKPDETVSCTDLAGYCRVQGSVLKRAVFASVDPDTNKPQYVSFAFNPALSTEANKKLERRLSRG